MKDIVDQIARSRHDQVFDGWSLREWRDRLKLTQIEAAELLGISRRTYCNYEWGRNERVPYYLRFACRYIEEAMNTDPDLRVVASRIRLRRQLQDAKLRAIRRETTEALEST